LSALQLRISAAEDPARTGPDVIIVPVRAAIAAALHVNRHLRV
jgi:hypothetical protein